jgi:integrase
MLMTAEELIHPDAYRRLKALPGLRAGRTSAKESPPVESVPDDVVESTLKFLPAVVADMVRIQRLTGARPGEICIMRPCDLDRTDQTWIFRPSKHKTQHLGRQRCICIGPKAQEILLPYLLRSPTAFCFSPRESEKQRRAEQHANRKTPLSYGNRPGTNRTAKPKRQVGDRYNTCAFRRAIQRGVERANRTRREQAEITEREPQLLPSWSPNQLRHTAATELRKQFGLEEAQVVLGHANADVTQIYAERDLQKAVEIMREVG